VSSSKLSEGECEDLAEFDKEVELAKNNTHRELIVLATILQNILQNTFG
jgi:hypothetical protein